MKTTFLDYYEKRKRLEKEKGNTFTQEHLATDIGISASLLSNIMLGKQIIRFKEADIIERKTNGALKADDILEESIQWHQKWLGRNEKFKKKTVD